MYADLKCFSIVVLLAFMGCDSTTSPTPIQQYRALPPIESRALKPLDQEEKKSIAAIKKLGGKVTVTSPRDGRAEVIVLRNTKVSDAGLVHLKGLTNLTSLSLDKTQVSNDGLENLKGLTNLRTLYLNDTKVSDDGLEHLKGLTKLGSLYLNNTQISDAGLKHLKGLDNLWYLLLNNTKVSNDGLMHLKGTNLHLLHLNGTQVTDAGLVHLKGLTELHDLDLSGTQVSDAGLEHLKGLTRLNNLDLENTQVTDQGIKELQEALPNYHVKRRMKEPGPRKKTVSQKNNPTKIPAAQKIDPSTIPALMASLNDPVERLRHWGGAPGGQFPDLFKQMRELKDHPDAVEMVKALEATKLGGEDHHIRLWASYALSTGNSFPIPPEPKGIERKPVSYWIKNLSHSDNNVRRWAIYTLGSEADDAESVVPEILRFLQDDDDMIQLESARAMGQFGPSAKSATRNLVELVSHRNHEVRIVAARALSKVDPIAAVPALIDLLNTEIDHVSKSRGSLTVSMTAAELLGSIGQDAISAAPALERAIEADNISIRVAAAHALNRVNPNSDVSTATLMEAMKHKHPHFRYQALLALSRIKEKAGVRRIASALKDDDKSVRNAAATLLGNAFDDELLRDVDLVKEASTALLAAIESEEDLAKNV